MEFMPGHPLWVRWRKLSTEAKSTLVKGIAHFQIELLTARLPTRNIGSTYFTQAYEQHSDHQEIEISVTRSADQMQVNSRTVRLNEVQNGQERGSRLNKLNSNQEVKSGDP